MTPGIPLYFSVPSLCKSLGFTLFYYQTLSAVCPYDNESYLYISSTRKMYKMAWVQRRATKMLRSGIWGTSITWKSRNWLPSRSQLSLEVHRDEPRGQGYKLQHEKFWLELRTHLHSLHRSCGVSAHTDIQHLTRQRPKQPDQTSGWNLTSKFALLSVGNWQKWTRGFFQLKSTSFASMVQWGKHSASFLSGKNIQPPHFLKSSLYAQVHWY